MKGLLLNHVYITQKTIRNSFLIAVVIISAFYVSGHSVALRGAAFIPFLVLIQPAFEVLKHDALSGWHKFVITLPLKRKAYIQSHYALALILILSAALISAGLFLIAQQLIDFDQVHTFYIFFLRGMSLVLIIAALVYPLTFKLGIEKSDSIVIISSVSSIGLFFATSTLFLFLFNIPSASFDLIFSFVFLGISLFIFTLSFFISTFIFNKKEY